MAKTGTLNLTDMIDFRIGCNSCNRRTLKRVMKINDLNRDRILSGGDVILITFQ